MSDILFIYMNEQIRRSRPRRPVIVVQNATGTIRAEGNMVVINGPSVVRFDHRGCPVVKTHSVTAWIEAQERDVVLKRDPDREAR
jgi:hypothetical protein